MSARTIANTAVFTAFVAAVTMAFAIYIPATKGYFDIGEVMVYVTAMLMGPYVGAFAGGVGSAISDAILAPQYAPGTLVIKAAEGYVVGYLTRAGASRMTRQTWRIVSGGIGGALAIALGWIGITQLSGPQVLSLGFANGPNALVLGPLVIPANSTIGPQFSANFFVPPLLWALIAAAAFFGIMVVGLRLDPEVGWTILSILLGGTAMVVGYFLFESIALQLGTVTAAVEVPINVGQVLVGLVVSVPVVRSIKRVAGGRRAFGEGPAK
ncbi:MAG TPA: ECF transporter S component [Nitrososphaerales archaeon]|nr:ECF transporter S component [Nitrososphaerales archaeon]